MKLTPGQAGDNPHLPPPLDEIRDLDVNGQQVRAGRVLADKAYTHPSTHKALRSRRIKATIPERADQIARRKAKETAFDSSLHKLRNCAKRAAYHRSISDEDPQDTS